MSYDSVASSKKARLFGASALFPSDNDRHGSQATDLPRKQINIKTEASVDTKVIDLTLSDSG